MNELKKDLILGMCYALASHFRNQFNDDQQQTYNKITATIDEIYYPKKLTNEPTSRGG